MDQLLCTTCQGLLAPLSGGPSLEQQIAGSKPGDISYVLRETVLQCADCGTRYVKQTIHSMEGELVAEKVKAAQSAEQQVDAKVDRGELLEKLRRLEEHKREVEEMKRTASKDYNDQLKDINGEIADVLTLLKAADAGTPKP